MGTAIALAILTLTDCILAGFRAAAGRNGSLNKRAYYRAAIVRALFYGLVLLALNVVVLVTLVLTAPDPAATWQLFVSAAGVCVLVFGIFSAFILGAFAFYFAPIGDFRVLTSVIVFGPLTLLRRVVIAGGLAFAVIRVPDVRVAILAVFAGITMLAFEPFLARFYRDQWRALVK